MELDRILDVARDGDGFRVDVPDGWQQGRGAYGGLAFGWLVRACAAAEPDRAVRSLSVQLCAPALPGPADLRVETLRRGSGMSHVAARLVQGGEVVAMAVGTVGLPRAPVSYQTLPMPEAPEWRAVKPLPPFPGMPTFARHYEFRPCLGGVPGQGARAWSGGWIAARLPGRRRDAAVVAALLDTWWPAALVRETAMRPMATVTALLQFVADGGDPAEPAFVEVRSDAAADGYTIEDRTLWDAGGRLLGVCRQTMVALK
jgi:acyl-CoA thioesterase